MNVLNEFQAKFKVSEYKIFESEYWIWSLRPHQATIGAGILSLKRECASFSGLESVEFADLDNIIKVIEPTLKRIFNYDVINYLMLMMVDKQVHYHVLLRFNAPVELFGQTWSDDSWPSIPTLSGDHLSEEKLLEILSYIKSNISLERRNNINE